MGTTVSDFHRDNSQYLSLATLTTLTYTHLTVRLLEPEQRTEKLRRGVTQLSRGHQELRHRERRRGILIVNQASTAGFAMASFRLHEHTSSLLSAEGLPLAHCEGAAR